jgi:hypothetical protein
MSSQKFVYRRHLAFVSALLVFIFFAADSAAQSGRRTPKVKSPAPVETPTPAPTPKSKPPVKPEFSLKVVGNISQALYTQFAFPEKMQRWVIERLENSPLLQAVAGESANLKEAQKMAKESIETFIVLVELQENPFGITGSVNAKARNGDIWIDFYVLTPETGKIKQKGRAYLTPAPFGGNAGILNRRVACYPNLRNEEYILLAASYEAAERIIAGFNLPVPPVECGQKF